MFLKNETAHLITLNTPMDLIKDAKGKVVHAEPGKAYDILPAGESVEVPKSVMEMGFTQTLIKMRKLTIVDEGVEVSDDNDEKSTLLALREEAETLGINYNGRWGEKKLREAIDDKLAEIASGE